MFQVLFSTINQRKLKLLLAKTTAIQLVANGVASHIVANGQFDESDVYQFDFFLLIKSN